jgi:hypothetical protein
MRKKHWIIDAVNEWIGTPGDNRYLRTEDMARQKFVWAGIILEFVPDMTQMELAKIAKVKTHTTIEDWYKGWRSLPVQVRHSWIEFFMGSGHKRAMMLMLGRDPLFQSLANPSQTDKDRRSRRLKEAVLPSRQ